MTTHTKNPDGTYTLTTLDGFVFPEITSGELAIYLIGFGDGIKAHQQVNSPTPSPSPDKKPA